MIEIKEKEPYKEYGSFTDNKKPNQFAYKSKWSDVTITLEPELGLYSVAYDAINGVQRCNIAIQLNEVVDEDYEPYATLTVNFGEFIGMKNVAYIDTNHLGADILDWLEENNMGNRTDFTKNNGYCSYPLFIFNEEFLKNIDRYGVYAKYEEQHAEYEKTYMGEIDDEKDITDEEW